MAIAKSQGSLKPPFTVSTCVLQIGTSPLNFTSAFPAALSKNIGANIIINPKTKIENFFIIITVVYLKDLVDHPPYQ